MEIIFRTFRFIYTKITHRCFTKITENSFSFYNDKNLITVYVSINDKNLVIDIEGDFSYNGNNGIVARYKNNDIVFDTIATALEYYDKEFYSIFILTPKYPQILIHGYLANTLSIRFKLSSISGRDHDRILITTKNSKMIDLF